MNVSYLAAADSELTEAINFYNNQRANLGFEFADQTFNKTCTVLVEITDACNLACAVCYSDAKGNRKLPLAQFKTHMRELIETKFARR